MKLCWDNLEKLKYIPSVKNWRKGTNTYIVHEACGICGDPFMGSPSAIYCSLGCRPPKPDGWKEKLSAAKKLFYKTSPKAEHVIKILKQKGKKLTGDKNPNWIKDRSKLKHPQTSIRMSQKMKDWRESVFKRDDWTCQECKNRGDNLNAHHIFPFAKYFYFRFATWNGITLCINCHSKTRSKEEKFIPQYIEHSLKGI